MNKSMLLGAVLALSLNVSLSFAQGDEKDFATHKAEISKEVDEHIKALQDHKSCIDGAKDKDALKACREKMKEYRHGNMMERMEGRKDRIDKRMEKMKKK
ncbi:MAG: hypothetical protein AABZ31_13405 [Bdellovibrionota bacterium]